MPDDGQKRYLYIDIDRAIRWVYLEVRCSQSAKDAKAFMKRVAEKAPFTIQTALTDNGKSFTDRFTGAGERKPSGRHPFDQECQAHGIEHRLAKPGRPQTSGMVGRFNGRICDVLATRRYTSGEGLEQTRKSYAWVQSPHRSEGAGLSISGHGNERVAGRAARVLVRAPGVLAATALPIASSARSRIPCACCS